MVLMIGVLLLDFTFFEVLSPFGDEGARAGTSALNAQ